MDRFNFYFFIQALDISKIFQTYPCFFHFQSFSPSKFSEVCQKNGIWLHLEGHALAALALAEESSAPTPNADSLSLTIGSWIGVPAVPFVTLYKVIYVLILK